jgi:hypothetical protein
MVARAEWRIAAGRYRIAVARSAGDLTLGGDLQLSVWIGVAFIAIPATPPTLTNTVSKSEHAALLTQ